jgi:chromosome segregation ATPase
VTAQEIEDLREVHAELTSLRAQRGYFRLTEWQWRVDAVLAALPALLDAAEDHEKWEHLLREQMAVTGQVLEENTQRMVTELVLAAENTQLQESLMAEGLKDAKAFMETETIKAMQGKIEQLRADLAETLYTLETTENTLRTEIEQLKSLLADDLKRRNRLEIECARLLQDVERLQVRDLDQATGVGLL